VKFLFLSFIVIKSFHIITAAHMIVHMMNCLMEVCLSLGDLGVGPMAVFRSRRITKLFTQHFQPTSACIPFHHSY